MCVMWCVCVLFTDCLLVVLKCVDVQELVDSFAIGNPFEVSGDEDDGDTTTRRRSVHVEVSGACTVL